MFKIIDRRPGPTPYRGMIPDRPKSRTFNIWLCTDQEIRDHFHGITLHAWRHPNVRKSLCGFYPYSHLLIEEHFIKAVAVGVTGCPECIKLATL